MNANKHIFAKITAIGGFVPENKRTNHDLATVCDTSDEWIVKRTGIKERRILDQNLATSDMGVEAIRNLFDKYDKDIEEVDALIVATSTPDMLMPSTANIICEKLQLDKVWAFDINAACSGFLYALNIASGLIESNRYHKILVVAADNISAFVDLNDRTTNILFGDGAGAVLLEADSQNGIFDSILRSNGEGKAFLNIEGGGSQYPSSMDNLEKHFIRQDGKIVFKKAVTAMSETCSEILKRNLLQPSDIQWMIPHQANKRIIDAVGQAIGLKEEQTLVNIEYYGNTIAATIPLCMWENVDKFKKDDVILLTAFGAGFSWGATLLKWGL